MSGFVDNTIAGQPAYGKKRFDEDVMLLPCQIQ